MKPLFDDCHPDGLIAAKRVQTPGLCIFCEEPLKGRQAFTCNASDCRYALNLSWKRDRQWERSRKQTTERVFPVRQSRLRDVESTESNEADLTSSAEALRAEGEQ